jgi:acetylornithine deacetylase
MSNMENLEGSLNQGSRPEHLANLHPAIRILDDLVRIQSVNPHFEAGAAGENGMADYIEAYFRRLAGARLTVTRQQVFPGRDNVIVELHTDPSRPTLLLEAHTDTVALGSMVDPQTPKYRDGRMYGRGACDTKASLAGMMYALEQSALHPEQLSANLVLCAAVDEEHKYQGLRAFLARNMPITAAVVGEPTKLGLVTAHKGCCRFAVKTHGKAAHSSMPHEGDSAIVQMMAVLEFIRDRIEPELKLQSHPLCGSPTIVVGMIRGGTQINIVPESCTIEVDRRMIPGETPEQVLADFEQRLRAFTADRGVRFTITELLRDWALNTAIDDPFVHTAGRIARELGLPGEPIGVPYGSDASKINRDGIPAIVFGPGSIAQAHSKEEWVELSQVERAAEFYRQLAVAFGTA